MWNIPNLLTLLRLLLIPVFALVYCAQQSWSNVAAMLIFILAALTDWLDGYLARRWQQTSPFGAFLDPVVDKLMVAVVLILLLQRHPDLWLAAPAAVIISREITISALREWMAEIGARGRVAVSTLGKVKTTMQMIALSLLIFEQSLSGIPIFTLGMVCLYVAALLTIWSMCLYLRAAWPTLTGTR